MSRITPGLQTLSYYYDERHFVLSDPKAGAFGPNIGIDGRNLTISFLSLNRARLSIRLINSLERHLTNFAGEVLIGDNGSDPAEINLLRERLATFPYRGRMLEFGRNFGVAGGRNRILAEVKTDWVISLDNDIYLTANPLGAIQAELATLGCHFMSFALLNPDQETLFSHGACLQTIIQNGRPRLTINPIMVAGSSVASSGDAQGPKEAFLCTFLFGGASIFNRHSFERLGGFDENMLVGFEDIDFSLRLFREGMKVATSGCLFLVHDHPKADTASDSEYEKIRFSRRILYESACYLEDKTGFRIWGDEVENWMRSNEAKQGWRNGEARPNPAVEHDADRPRRPRVALITDTDDWAFANISSQLKRYLSDRFDFEVIPLVTLAEIEKSRWYQTNCTGFFAEGGAAALGMALLMAEDFDIIHVFWREFLTVIDTPLLEAYARRLGMSYLEFRRRFIENKIISTSVYDHLFLDEKAIATRAKLFTELTSAYYVSSERLGKIYESIPGYPRPAAVLPDGVDLTLFEPRNLARFDEVGSRYLCVGWVGHSGWAATLEDFKGVNTILLPAIEQLKREGFRIETNFADRKERFIPHRQMPNYYAGIDVLICTSKIEGTPNPVLEAMACGVPVITTDVGVVPQLLGPSQKQFVLAERSIEALKEAIQRLIAEPKQLAVLSAENVQSIKAWDWSQRAESFTPYFNRLLDLKELGSGELRTKMCLLPFSSPSMEPDGSIRLCSASSIFAYYDETNMGNCRVEGLGKVWKGERYREVRRGLLTGKDLKPYCATCEYRFDGPAWLMQLHLALHAYHSGTHSSGVLALIGRRMGRYEEYEARAPSLGLQAYALTDELRRRSLEAYLAQTTGPQKGLEHRLAPEALIDCSGLPLYMDFNTLNRCNVTCTMCPPAIRYDKLGKKRDPYYRLTLQEYKKITDSVRIETAHFVGAYAEPLLNKDIFSLIGHAKSNGAFAAITTNAMALSRQFGERLVDAGLDMMTISLHGATKEVAESIMEKSNFERIIANIRGFQTLKKERSIARPEIYFNYVTQKKNVHDMPAFVDLAHELGIRFVNFIHLIDGDPAVDRSENLLNYPELLIPNIHLAEARAREKRVVLNISPAYKEVLGSALGKN